MGRSTFSEYTVVASHAPRPEGKDHGFLVGEDLDGLKGGGHVYDRSDLVNTQNAPQPLGKSHAKSVQRPYRVLLGSPQWYLVAIYIERSLSGIE